VELEQGYFQTLDLIENELDRRFDQEDLTVAASREKLLLADEGESHAEELMIQLKLQASTDRDKLQRQLLQLATRNSSGDEIAKRDFSVYLFIPQLYINSCILLIYQVS